MSKQYVVCIKDANGNVFDEIYTANTPYDAQKKALKDGKYSIEDILSIRFYNPSAKASNGVGGNILRSDQSEGYYPTKERDDSEDIDKMSYDEYQRYLIVNNID